MSQNIDLKKFFSEEKLHQAFIKYEKAKTDLYQESLIKIRTGADGITYEDFRKNLERNSKDISKAVLRGRFLFYPFREVKIAKKLGDPSAGHRILSVARIRDVLVQKQIYEAVYENAKERFDCFNDISFGYWKTKSVHQAIYQVWESYKQKYSYVLDADIEKFFDNLNHDYLISITDEWLKDEKILADLIRRFIKTDRVKAETYDRKDWEKYFQRTKPERTERRLGIPQGGILSGLLANIYLYELDRWVVQDLSKKFDFKYYRYADDFVVMTRTREDAIAIYEEFRIKLSSIYLKIHELSTVKSGKTKIVYIPTDGLEFLGFQITAEKIRIKENNVEAYKARFLESIERTRTLKRKKPFEKFLAKTVKYYVNSKIVGPPDDCPNCNLPRRRYNWISFFAPTVTDVTQIRSLDVWMRRELHNFFWNHYKQRVRKKHLEAAEMTSILKEYRRFRKRKFCACDPDELWYEDEENTEHE